MAGEPSWAILLLGFGLDEFSTSPIVLPEIKKMIRAVSMKEAREIAEKALTLSTGREVEAYVNSRLKEILPELAAEV